MRVQLGLQVFYFLHGTERTPGIVGPWLLWWFHQVLLWGLLGNGWSIGLLESSRDNRKGLRNSTLFCTGKSSMKPYWNCSSGMRLPFWGSSCCKCSKGGDDGVNGAVTGAWRGQAWLSSSTKLSTAGDEPLGREGSIVSQYGTSAKELSTPPQGTWFGILNTHSRFCVQFENKLLNVHHISHKSYDRPLITLQCMEVTLLTLTQLLSINEPYGGMTVQILLRIGILIAQ